MSRSVLGMVVGAVLALVGAALVLWAGDLGTQWQALGGGAWGGTTDPDAVRAYRDVGLVVLAAGAGLACLAFFRWTAGPRGAAP